MAFAAGLPGAPPRFCARRRIRHRIPVRAAERRVFAAVGNRRRRPRRLRADAGGISVGNYVPAERNQP